MKKPKLNIVPPVPKRFRRVRGEEKIREAFENIPRITNETVAEHREDVLKGARKYKYPLQHSKHTIVVISTSLLIAGVVAFATYIGLALYKFQASNSFVYRVTQIVPLPVARAGGHWVAYENYLFELRRYEHYYQTQQQVNFNSAEGKQQLKSYKPQALNEVVQAAYVQQLARVHHVSVSNEEVNAAINSLMAENQSSQQELTDVTSRFFGWSLNDLKREIKQELLAEKTAAALDTQATSKAQNILAQLQTGGDFTALGGAAYANTAITSTSTDVPPAVVRQLQTMQVGQTSGIIVADSTLEIVKLTAKNGETMQASHISFAVTPIATQVKQYQKTHPLHTFITVK